MHRNESIFPAPERFDPGRWLDPLAVRGRDKHLVSFGKGSRQCVGMPFVSLPFSPPLLRTLLTLSSSIVLRIVSFMSR
jgi:cytochrome P450